MGALPVDSSLYCIHGETCRQLGAIVVLRKFRAIALEGATLKKDIFDAGDCLRRVVQYSEAVRGH